MAASAQNILFSVGGPRRQAPADLAAMTASGMPYDDEEENGDLEKNPIEKRSRTTKKSLPTFWSAKGIVLF